MALRLTIQPGNLEADWNPSFWISALNGIHYYIEFVRGVNFRNWFKGADTVSLCKFLEHKFASVLPACEPDARPYVRNILAMLRACNTFMSTMYHGDVFLTDDERRILIRNGYVVTGKFAACASHAYLTPEHPEVQVPTKVSLLRRGCFQA